MFCGLAYVSSCQLFFGSGPIPLTVRFILKGVEDADRTINSSKNKKALGFSQKVRSGFSGRGGGCRRDMTALWACFLSHAWHRRTDGWMLVHRTSIEFIEIRVCFVVVDF